jgi:hypothetical protein
MAELSFEDLIQMVVITAGVVGAPPLSPAVARAMLQRLEKYPAGDIVRALQRCQEEIHDHRFALADVIERLKALDGRPGSDEAWAIAAPAKDENATVVWTPEIEAAYGVARSLHKAGDDTAARMAFRSAYIGLVDTARARGEISRWWASLGHDVNGRRAPIEAAIALGRLSAEARSLISGEQHEARRLLPAPSEAELSAACAAPPELKALIDKVLKRPAEQEGGQNER